jgi:hypothetical protein
LRLTEREDWQAQPQHTGKHESGLQRAGWQLVLSGGGRREARAHGSPGHAYGQAVSETYAYADQWAACARRQVMQVGGREYLWFRAPPAIHAALLRGTTADEDGNIGFEDEACYIDALNQACHAARAPVTCGA